MNQISRRSLLRSLAAAPLVSALSPLENAFPQTRRPKTELCLWFHGLFAFVIMHDYIAVVTPKVPDHEFLAGLWKQEQKLREGEWYRLSGVSDSTRPNRMPALTKDQILFLSGVKAVNMAESFCLIRLPFPRQIIPLRYAKAQFSGGDAPKTNNPSTFPTVQVMRYQVVDYGNLRLEPFKAWVTQKRPPSIINLHIFAEPDVLVHPEHAMRAFDGMIQLFSGIDLKLNDTSSACFPLDFNLPAGINPQHQVSLAERNGACKKSSGSRTANCFMIMLDARTSTDGAAKNH
ncbi:MAG TPA: hypothetical protein VFS77_21335 [Pyrinomonadaceae bacterium]|nr:hypothetical protein [Pyrinomonadaceae bacterium]